MRGRAFLLAQMAMAMAVTASGSPAQSSTNPVTDEDIERSQRRTRQRYQDNLKKKGVQEFNINGKIVLARNYKNALRKARIEGDSTTLK